MAVVVAGDLGSGSRRGGGRYVGRNALGERQLAKLVGFTGAAHVPQSNRGVRCAEIVRPYGKVRAIRCHRQKCSRILIAGTKKENAGPT